MAIELTDVVFALDSIPAVLSITRQPFLAYTSNIMAVMGLRSLYFLIIGMLTRLRFLHAFGLLRPFWPSLPSRCSPPAGLKSAPSSRSRSSSLSSRSPWAHRSWPGPRKRPDGAANGVLPNAGGKTFSTSRPASAPRAKPK